MQTSGAVSSFFTLPTEMKLEIFKYLEPEEKMNARRVCKDWGNVLGSCFKFSFRASDSGVNFLLHTKQVVKRIEARQLLKQLSISSSRGGILATTDELAINSKVSADNVRKLLHNCWNISLLELNYLSKSALQSASLIGKSFLMENLRELKLTFPKFEPYQGTFLKKMADSSVEAFPSLWALEIYWSHSSLMGTKLRCEFYEAYLSVHQLIRKHSASLEFVEIDFSKAGCCNWTQPPITLTCGMKQRHSELTAILGGYRLVLLTMGFAAHEGEYPWNLSTMLMMAQTKLGTVGFDMEAVPLLHYSPLKNMLTTVHSKCSGTLISTLIILPGIMELDCSWLSSCNKLKMMFARSREPLANVQSLPKNLKDLTLHGRPNLSSDDRSWMAQNLDSLDRLDINLVSYPVLWMDPIDELEILGDIELFLRMPNITILSLSTFAFYDYTGLMLLANELGFSYKIDIDFQLQKVRLDFTKD